MFTLIKTLHSKYCVHMNVNRKKISVAIISPVGKRNKGEWWRG
jgi:hypothetical protein